MKRVLYLLPIVLLLTLFGCVTKSNKEGLPLLSQENIKTVYATDTRSSTFRVVEDSNFIGKLIKAYNESKVAADQSFETTPEYQIKLILKDGREFLMMDGDGPNALFKLSDGSKQVLTGPLGPFIDKNTPNLSFGNHEVRQSFSPRLESFSIENRDTVILKFDNSIDLNRQLSLRLLNPQEPVWDGENKVFKYSFGGFKYEITLYDIKLSIPFGKVFRDPIVSSGPIYIVQGAVPPDDSQIVIYVGIGKEERKARINQRGRNEVVITIE